MTPREYGQACSLACALDRIGERWTLLIVRELSLGPLRFSALARSVGGAPTDVLTKRLKLKGALMLLRTMYVLEFIRDMIRDSKSSTSTGLTRVATRANALATGPISQVTRSWLWIACISKTPPCSVSQRPRHGVS